MDTYQQDVTQLQSLFSKFETQIEEIEAAKKDKS
jgi:hypothetical protein